MSTDESKSAGHVMVRTLDAGFMSLSSDSPVRLRSDTPLRLDFGDALSAESMEMLLEELHGTHIQVTNEVNDEREPGSTYTENLFLKGETGARAWVVIERGRDAAPCLSYVCSPDPPQGAHELNVLGVSVWILYSRDGFMVNSACELYVES
jgi:hypothetical protein